MTSKDFCYWLQGYFEIEDGPELVNLNSRQVEKIRKHLDMVFAHEIDPSYGGQTQQDVLNHLHNGPKPTNPDVKIRC